jgi:uncharacterized membrane protein
MTERAAGLTPEEMDRLSRRLGLVLAAGALVGGIMLASGIALVLMQNVSPSNLTSTWVLPGLSVSGAGSWSGGLLMAGILIILAIPFMRVATSAVTFAVGRERDYAAVTLLVLLILAVTATVGLLFPSITSP